MGNRRFQLQRVGDDVLVHARGSLAVLPLPRGEFDFARPPATLRHHFIQSLAGWSKSDYFVASADATDNAPGTWLHRVSAGRWRLVERAASGDSIVLSAARPGEVLAMTQRWASHLDGQGAASFRWLPPGMKLGRAFPQLAIPPDCERVVHPYSFLAGPMGDVAVFGTGCDATTAYVELFALEGRPARALAVAFSDESRFRAAIGDELWFEEDAAPSANRLHRFTANSHDVLTLPAVGALVAFTGTAGGPYFLALSRQMWELDGWRSDPESPQGAAPSLTELRLPQLATGVRLKLPTAEEDPFNSSGITVDHVNGIFELDSLALEASGALLLSANGVLYAERRAGQGSPPASDAAP